MAVRRREFLPARRVTEEWIHAIVRVELEEAIAIGGVVQVPAAVGGKREMILRRHERALIEHARIAPRILVFLEQLHLLRGVSERDLAKTNQQARSLTRLVVPPGRNV